MPPMDAEVPFDAEREYNNRARVPGHGAVIAKWARDAAAFRAAAPAGSRLAIPYGPGERQHFDLFGPAEGQPVAMFIHGGYWQALDGSFVSHCAAGLVARGVSVAVPTHDLAPAVPLAAIVEQARAAALALHRLTGRRILAMGHSAGGHLAAMLAATDWCAIDARLPQRLVGAILPVSGLFELEPLLGTSVVAAMGLDRATARVLSPRFLPAPGVPAHAVVGGEESSEYLRQTRDFAAAWGGSSEAVPGADHFTVLAPFADPAHPLVGRAAAMARLP
ncbi:alpha/beta hydrolase [Roseomonas hellenica]|nr:alpha/beta hydrolase [Plastoroseomonas hellenica]